MAKVLLREGVMISQGVFLWYSVASVGRRSRGKVEALHEVCQKYLRMVEGQK